MNNLSNAQHGRPRVLVLVLLLPLVLAACSKSASSTMQSFCNDLSAGHWEKAMTQLGQESEMRKSIGDLENDPQSKQVVGAMLSSAKCKVTAAKDNQVSLEMDTVNGSAVIGQVMADSLGMAFVSAFSGPDGKKALEEAMLTKMVEGFTSPNAPRRKTQVDVQMEKQGGQWVPATGNDEFASALVGGVDQLGK